jgi:SRSO17 transposase
LDLHDETGTEARFRAYAADLASVLGHADRVRPFEAYCVGLLSADGRKSVEPLAAVTALERTAAQHQSLRHLVAQAPWSDQAVLTRVRDRVLPSRPGCHPSGSFGAASGNRALLGRVSREIVLGLTA